ncbi:MAG TPA: T9SS type A sorting domain-containing protein [Bacteroidia bacterium]|nr:T9SS type A sorting domain-containing protein [Bacteroidia bacterium]
MQGLKKYHPKKIFLFVLFLLGMKLQSQIIAPITFTASGPFPANTHCNAVADDSINNRLYLQSSCICGVGPGNVYSGLSYVNLSTNITAAFTGYNPFGQQVITKEMQYGNNGLNVNDSKYLRRFNVPPFTTAWTYSPATSQTVVASVMRNDSVFTITDDGGYCQILEIRNRNTGALLTFNTIDCSTFLKGAIYGDVAVAKLFGNKLYLAGAFTAYDASSNPVEDNITSINLSNGQISPLNFQVNDSIKDLEFYNGKIHIAGNFTSAKSQTRNHYAVFDLSGNLQNGTPSFNDNVEKIEVYDNYLFALGKYTTINSSLVNPSGNFILKAVNLNTNSIMNWSFPFSVALLSGDDYMLENYRNRLFVSNKVYGPFAIDAFCLPPIKTNSLTAAATASFCEQTNNVTFSISPFTYASSYVWSYTGTGASISFSNNIASVNFASGATSGKLKVFTNSSCGSVSDTVSLNITIWPRPNATASLIDDTLNCFKPKVPILGNSTTPGVGYSWSGPSIYTSVQQNDSTGKYLPGVYTLIVTTLATGCTRTVSVLVSLDTLKPNVTLPTGPYQIGCGTNSVIVLNGTSTTTPTSLFWHYQAATTYSANPYSTSLIGKHFLTVFNTYNGCKDSSSLVITSSGVPPTVTLTSHSYINVLTPVDSITCLTTSVTLSVAFSPTNCTIVWKDKATNTLTSNPVTVFGQNNQMAIVTRLDNSCVDSSLIVYVKQNITQPNIIVLTPNANINCSSSTETLNAAFSPTTVSSGVWTGPSSFSSSNPAVASVQGKYYFTVTRSDNGCSKKDSVTVGYSNTLVVDAGKDTTVCKNSTANLSVAVVGTVSGVTYNWNPGGVGQTISVNTTVTASYIVTANGPLGCTGKDTVVVNIPRDIQDSIVTAKGCSGNNGSLTIYVKGGIAPYKYSVNGSPFTSQIAYSNLPFATYSVSIKDSIGCILNTTATINQNSNLNTPVFIASTQNFKGDTVVLIDLTTPKADSVKWILPGAHIIGGDMFNPVVVFADTGSFPVTLEAFYGICITSSTKTIKIMQWDSAYATLTNNNGIKTLNLFPNPNGGQFTVQVEFYKKQNASVQIWDSSPQKHFQQNFLDVDIISLPVNVTQLQNGTYILKVISEYASKYFYFLINK